VSVELKEPAAPPARQVFARMDAQKACEMLQTDPQSGLTLVNVERSRDKNGPNQLESPPRRTFCDLLLPQLKDLLVVLLMLAALTAFIIALVTKAHFEEFVAPIFIVFIVIANAVLGVTQEGAADDAVAALDKKSVTKVEVLREGKKVSIDQVEVVVGDIIILGLGVIACADARVIEDNNLSMEEAFLTGESVPVKKKASVSEKEVKAWDEAEAEKKAKEDRDRALKEAREGKGAAAAEPELTEEEKAQMKFLEQQKKTPDGVHERMTIVYRGSATSTGNAKAVVFATGMNTRMGDLVRMMNDIEATPTPLQQRLGVLAEQLGIASIVVSLIVFIIGVATGRGSNPNSDQSRVIQMLLIAVSLTVAAVPEGLPVCVTIALSIGMKTMADQNGVVKNLKSVETLGSANIICSDKTGTLTKGEMTAKEYVTLKNRFPITGLGYAPVGTVTPESFSSDPESLMFLVVAKMCNEASLEQKTVDGKSVWIAGGNLTDRALLCLSKKANIPCPYTEVKQNPFESTRKMASTLIAFTNEGKNYFPQDKISLVKGAPNIILEKCKFVSDGGEMRPITQADKDALLAKVDEYSDKAMRVLAHAYSLHADPEMEVAITESDLVFIGMAAIEDPPRDEVPPAIRKCHGAGIDVRMITGDYVKTAEAIAKSIGLIKQDSVGEAIDCRAIQDLEGRQDEVSKKKLNDLIMKTKVFARARPEDKILIVTILQDNKMICSMTGDGVNDAPSLKKADIGVAMGITGTDAAKAAASMVLMDDSFSSIVKAVEEGRRIYQNIRKFVYFLLSTNICEVLFILICTFIGLRSPLVPVQILWMNLMTDSLCALALANEPIEASFMQEPPKAKEAAIIDKLMITSIGLHTLCLTSVCLATYLYGLQKFTGFWNGVNPELNLEIAEGNETLMAELEVLESQVRQAQSMSVYVIVFAELLRAYTCRSLRASVFTQGILTNSWMQGAVFGAIALTFFIGAVPGVMDVFGMEYFEGEPWAVVIGLSIFPALWDETLKWIYRTTGYGFERVAH